jgi:acetyl esterase
MTMAETRAAMLSARRHQRAVLEPVTVVDGMANGVPVRLYGEAAGGALLYFHGGRFISGDLETHDLFCRELAVGSGCRVCAVDYRLAPEHRFPAAYEDALAAGEWLRGEADRVVVGGDSAGGALAAAIAGTGFVGQMLFYPMLDALSNRAVPEGPWPNATDMRRGWEAYAAGEERNPRVSPLWVEDYRWFPPTYLVTAEVDPLRGENLEFVERLRAAGVSVEHRDYAGMAHGFALMTGVFGQAREAVATAAGAVRGMLGA